MIVRFTRSEREGEWLPASPATSHWIEFSESEVDAIERTLDELIPRIERAREHDLLTRLRYFFRSSTR